MRGRHARSAFEMKSWSSTRATCVTLLGLTLLCLDCGSTNLDTSDALNELPAPRWMSDVAADCMAITSVCVRGESAVGGALISDALAAAGVSTSENGCNWNIAVTTSATALSADAQARLANSAANEQFAFSTRVAPDGLSANTAVVSPTGTAFRYAAHRLIGQLRHARSQTCVNSRDAFDYPSYRTRGVVEGFYGDPYSIDDRRTLLGLMAELDMNAYLYGPKGDKYVHDSWRLPYSMADGSAQAMVTLVEDANRLGIQPIWAISPAPNAFGFSTTTNSIKFSSADDFAALIAKADAMRKIGFARFALFVDDTSPELYWPEDQAAYPTSAVAHASLANRYLAHLRQQDPAARLLFVGRDYAQSIATWERYNTELAKTLSEGVDVMWTGPLIYSKTIAPADLTSIETILDRHVTIWDNAPEQVVPLTGRASDLPTVVDAMFTNPVMNEWRYHPVTDYWQTIGSIGLYQWNSENYDAEAAFDSWKKIHAFP